MEGNSRDKTFQMLEKLTKDFSNSFQISLLKQTSKGKKNAVVEGFNISSGETSKSFIWIEDNSIEKKTY